jgi:hypothetical protein
MGACFSIQAFIENGLLTGDHDIGEIGYVRSSTGTLFLNLKSGLFPGDNVSPGYRDLADFNNKTKEALQEDLCAAYRYASNIFRPPEMGKIMYDTLPSESNLPFINERPLDETRSHLLHITVLEIHAEYLAKRIRVC